MMIPVAIFFVSVGLLAIAQAINELNKTLLLIHKATPPSATAAESKT